MDCDNILFGTVALVALVAAWFVIVGLAYAVVRLLYWWRS